MAYLEIRGERHPVGVGEMVIGCDADNVIALGGDELQSKSAVLQGMRDGQVAVQRADSESEVLINGVKLGPQPTPLLHGDKIEVAGQELLFVDDRRSGSTEYIKAVDPSTIGGPSKSKSKGGATAGTGGRLVSLTDGREYEIPAGSILIGRDAGCDIVLSAKNVSRRHAEVVATPRGYILIDNSTNGTLVNNERVKGQHVLARADVIRCGDHEFRFYADKAEVIGEQPSAPKPDVAQASDEEHAKQFAGEGSSPDSPQTEQPPSPGSPPEPEAPAPRPAPGAEQRLAHTMHGIPAMPRPPRPGQPGAPPRESSPPPVPPPGAEQQLKDTLHGVPGEALASLSRKPGQEPAAAEATGGPPPASRPSGAPKSLASLMVRSGALRGQRVHVKVPIVNIGRAEYNDVVIPDESVSTVHAKLQRREGIWVVVDLESTNGTIVDGLPVEGEAPLAPGAIIRFGTIQTVFEPTDDLVESQQGGGTQVLQNVKLTPPAGEDQSGSSGSGSTPEGGTPVR